MSSSSSCSDIDDSENPVWGKYLKNRVCYKELPGVINDKLLKDLLQKQMEGDETGKLLLENGIIYEKVTELRLEFCKILRIDHLWMMSNLKILKMNNNFIEKIENLDELTALTDLDLSFNKIVVIENLDKLVNLGKLSLFENSISEIENMENLKNLTIFSIGGNEISDLKNVIYLRKLPKLRSLNMAGNPCCNEQDFRYFLATYLPNLEYYEYRAITKIERQIGDEMFHDEYALMLEKEKLEKTSQYKHEIEEHDAQVNAESFVEYLNTRRLFESFFENDPEGSALLLIGAEAKKLYVTYEENIVGICRDLFRMGQTQHEIRQENLNEFENSVKVIQTQNQTEAIGFMEHFLEEKSIIVEDLKDIRWEMNRKNVQEPRTLWERVKDLSKNFEELSNSLWKDLMKLESVLFEQMMELNETYENTLSDLITSFIEQAQGMFVTMRDVVAEYNDSIQEIAQMYYATVVLEEEEAEKDRLEAERKKKELEREALKSGKTKTSKSLIPYDLEQETKDGREETTEVKEIEPPRNRIPEELKPHVKDRETLMNALAGSRDIHLLMVDNREDLLVSKARDWQQDVIRTLYQNEVKRNREKVLEITHFLNVQNDEFHLLSDELENNLKIIVSAEELG